MGGQDSKGPKLKFPYYPGDNDAGKYSMETIMEKRVADYANISILDAEELDIITFFIFLRDAVIFEKSQTEKGREYLYNAWRIDQVQPEREKVREQIKKGGGTDG